MEKVNIDAKENQETNADISEAILDYHPPEPAFQQYWIVPCNVYDALKRDPSLFSKAMEKMFSK